MESTLTSDIEEMSGNNGVPVPNEGHDPATKFSDIVVGKGLHAVIGVVVTRSMCRPISQRRDAEDMENSDDDFANYDDNGPAGRRSHKKVFDVTLACGTIPSSCTKKLNAYFYDKWAEKLQFLREGDTVVITCDEGVVRTHPEGEERDTDDHACCLVIGDGGLEMAEAVEIRVLRKNKTSYEFNSTDACFQEVEMAINGAPGDGAAAAAAAGGVRSPEGSVQGKKRPRVFRPEELDAGGIPKKSCSTLSERREFIEQQQQQQQRGQAGSAMEALMMENNGTEAAAAAVQPRAKTGDDLLDLVNDINGFLHASDQQPASASSSSSAAASSSSSRAGANNQAQSLPAVPMRNAAERLLGPVGGGAGGNHQPPPAPKQGSGERYAPYNYKPLKESVFCTMKDPSINVYAVIVSSTTGETH